MGLFDFIWKLLGGSPRGAKPAETSSHYSPSAQSPSPRNRSETTEHSAPDNSVATATATRAATAASPQRRSKERLRSEKRRPRVVLEPLQYQPSLIPTRPDQEVVRTRPYRFASIGLLPGEYLDLSKDSDPRWLEYYGLPALHTPDELADWLGVSLGTLAWLTHRTAEGHRPGTEKKSHYFYKWIAKRSGGWRLIEAPKTELKLAQEQVLREILNHVPTHNAAHGFVLGRSILTNATPHIGQRFLLKLDLKDFYTNVRYSRVVAIFRSLGYSREVAIWLARLTTSSLPWNIKSPVSAVELNRYASRHLPQGAPTSPALANLSAFALDVRLTGLAKSYGLKYTRYADDLTFSGPGKSVPALHEIIPLISKIIRSERFYPNSKKFRILRNGQRQTVTGVVVNERLNVARTEFDSLKAILTNCARSGPSTQNRQEHPNFQDHLRGRIAHVQQLNQTRGLKLMGIFNQIDWSK